MLCFCLVYSSLYHTGDFGRIVKGNLVYEGRADSQIKVRGHRVDLAEIQAAVQTVPGLDKALVLCYQPGRPEQVIFPYSTFSFLLMYGHFRFQIPSPKAY